MNPEFAVRVEGPYDGSACIFASPNGRIGTRRRSGDRLRDLQLSIHLRRARRLFRKPLVSASAVARRHFQDHDRSHVSLQVDLKVGSPPVSITTDRPTKRRPGIGVA